MNSLVYVLQMMPYQLICDIFVSVWSEKCLNQIYTFVLSANMCPCSFQLPFCCCYAVVPTGYLTASLCLHEGHELNMLLVNTLQKVTFYQEFTIKGL